MKKRRETTNLELDLLAVGRAMRSQIFRRGLIMLITFSVLGLVALYVLDFITDMPYPVRLITFLGAGIYGARWFVTRFLRESRKPVDAQSISLIVENAHPELQSRMISTLQFQELKEVSTGMSEDLMEGVVDQTFEQIRSLDMQSVIDRSWFKRKFLMLVGAMILCALAVAVSPPHFIAFVMRVAVPGIEYPTSTKILLVKLPVPMPAGDPFTVEVTASGVLPEIGNLTLTDSDGDEAEFDLIKNEAGLYTCELPGITKKAEIHIAIGDTDTDSISIVPNYRPNILSFESTVNFPAYTGIKKKSEESGNLRVLEGSTIELIIEASKELKSAQLISEKQKMPELKHAGKNKWTAKIVANKSFGFTIKMTDKLGLNSKELPQYRVTVMRDRSPRITVRKPLDNWECAPKSKIPLVFEVRDDYRVKNIKLMYNVIDTDDYEAALGEGREPKFGKPVLYGNLGDAKDSKYEFSGYWQNSQINVKAGQIILFWISASDNRAPKPQVVTTEKHTIRVITAKEYRAFLFKQLDAHTEQVDEVTLEIKDNIRESEKIIRELDNPKKKN